MWADAELFNFKLKHKNMGTKVLLNLPIYEEYVMLISEYVFLSSNTLMCVLLISQAYRALQTIISKSIKTLVWNKHSKSVVVNR